MSLLPQAEFLGGFLLLVLVYMAGRVLFTGRVVKQANETVELYDSKIKLLEEERDKLHDEVSDLKRRMGVLEELVTRSAAVDALARSVADGFAGLHERLDSLVGDSRGGSSA